MHTAQQQLSTVSCASRAETKCVLAALEVVGPNLASAPQQAEVRQSGKALAESPRAEMVHSRWSLPPLRDLQSWNTNFQ
jgi:hypothetical protein